jgi:large subunit ribosomal protein L5
MKYTKNSFSLISTAEDNLYNYNLDFCTKFHTETSNLHNQCEKISLNFGFKDIKFEKKNMIIYFFLLELMTNQKCVITISSKNLIAFKIKKGSITGCKVTLQGNSLFNFIETLLISLPRSEIFKGFLFKKNTLKYQSYSTKITNLFIFYMIESELTNFIKYVDITFNFSSINDIEKSFFFTHNRFPLNRI